MSSRTGRVPRARRQTLHFLGELRSASPVFLDTEVDMGPVQEHRAAQAAEGNRYSTLSYVVQVAARVVAAHPDANSAIGRGFPPRIARYETVNVKLALDRNLDGQRAVLAAVLPAVERASLADIQRQIAYYRDGDPATLPEFAGVRALQRMWWPAAALAFRLGVRPLHRRAEAFGTLAISSLSHRAVDGFSSLGGTALTLGLGRVTDRPVVRAGRLEIAPVMRLNLTFDHRVLDGAEAADVLTEIKDGLEGYRGTATPVSAGSAGGEHRE